MSLEKFCKYLENLGFSEKIIDAFRKIKREWFVPEEYKNLAYEDVVIPIKEGVTISQPSVLAYMLEYLDLEKGLKVLEIGTGSGFSTALISYLIGESGKIISIEIDEYAYKYANEKIKELIEKKIIPNNIKIVLGDGSLGYPKEAPYDRIISHAGCYKIPNPWLWQLKENGIIVAPVGPVWGQKLTKIIKKKDKLEKQEIIDVIFVPLKGKFGDIE